MHNAIKRHRTDAITDTVLFQFSSVQDGIYALRKAQVCSSRSLGSFPKYCLKRWVLKLGSKAGRAVTDAIANCPIAVQLSSRWYFCTWKRPGVLPPVSQKFPQILSEEVGFETGFEGRERELRAATEQGNRKQGERVKGCDRTGKQKAGRES